MQPPDLFYDNIKICLPDQRTDRVSRLIPITIFKTLSLLFPDTKDQITHNRYLLYQPAGSWCYNVYDHRQKYIL